MIKFSIVIPFKNEEENISDLINEIEPAMKQLNEPWELICIDDGSTDNTLSVLKKLSSENNHLRILVFTENFGQSSGFDAGFKAARGEFVITMDGDRQNDPADIPKLWKARGDADLVCGRRAKRRDPFIKRIISKAANFIRSRFCHDGVQDTGCSLKLYRREALLSIKLFHGMHRFLPALFKIEGFKVREVDVNHRERTRGKTKYNIFNRSFNTISDMFAVRWMRSRRLKYQIKEEIT